MEDIWVSLVDLVTEKLTGLRSRQEIGNGLWTNKESFVQWRETESGKSKGHKQERSLPWSTLSHSRGSRLLTDTLYCGQYRWGGVLVHWCWERVGVGQIRNTCGLLWYKCCCPRGRFQAANSFTTSLQHSWLFNSQLLQAGTSQLWHTAAWYMLETMGVQP